MKKIDSCGVHSTRLRQIAEDILKTKKENGEVVNSIDEDYIDSELYIGYQKILAYSKDGGDIAVALTTMEQLISTGTTVTEIPAVVETAIRNMELEREGLDLGTGEEAISIANLAATMATAGAFSVISQFENPNVTFNINNLYNEGLQNQINTLYSEAAVGNFAATKNIIGIQQLTKVTQLFCNGGKNMNSKAVLGWMKNVATMEFPVADEALIANVQYLIAQGKGEEFQDLITEKDGQMVFSRERLQERFEQEVGKVNPKAAQMADADFARLMDKRAKEAVADGRFKTPGMTIERFGKEEEQRANERIFSRNMIKAMDAGETELVRKLISENPQGAKAMLDTHLKAQQSGKLPAKAMQKVQERCLVLGKYMSELQPEREVAQDEAVKKASRIQTGRRKEEEDEMMR